MITLALGRSGFIIRMIEFDGATTNKCGIDVCMHSQHNSFDDNVHVLYICIAYSFHIGFFNQMNTTDILCRFFHFFPYSL